MKSKMSSKIKNFRSTNCRRWEEGIDLYVLSTFSMHSGPSLRELPTYLDTANASIGDAGYETSSFFKPSVFLFSLSSHSSKCFSFKITGIRVWILDMSALGVVVMIAKLGNSSPLSFFHTENNPANIKRPWFFIRMHIGCFTSTSFFFPFTSTVAVLLFHS